MKPLNKLTDIINDLDSGQELEALASTVVNEVLSKHTSTAFAVLLPVIRGEIITMRRLQAYAKEQRIYEDIVNGRARRASGTCISSVAANPIDSFRELLGQTIFIPNYGRVLWDDATVPQLESRRQLLEQKARGHLASAMFLQEVIDTLVANQVQCLGDLDKKANQS
jgi:hypothetical protein